MELIDFIEIYENKKITIHFKFMDEIKNTAVKKRKKKRSTNPAVRVLKKVNLSAVC